MSVVVKYNDIEIDPAPLIESMATTYTRNASGRIIGCKTTISLKGNTLCNFEGFSENVERMLTIKDIFSCDGVFTIECDSVILYSACARVLSVEFAESDSNWVLSIPYSIQLETLDGECCIEDNLLSLEENWSINPEQDCSFFSFDGLRVPARALVIEHTVSAAAQDTCIDTGTTPGWQVARDYVSGMLGFNEDIVDTNLGMNCLGDYQLYNYYRQSEFNTSAGSYQITETWVMAQHTGDDPYIKETVEVSVNKSNSSRLATVTISGEVLGYEDVNFDTGCYNVVSTKYENALEYFNDYLVDTLAEKAEAMSGLTLSPAPVSSSVSHNPCAGRIAYNYTFDNAIFCLTIPECDVLAENITISENNPADVYAEHRVLGKACPILQNLGIRTKGTKEINITLTLDCGDPCSNNYLYEKPILTGVDAIIEDCYDNLTGTYGAVYTDSDSESWDGKSGVYNRRVAFSYTSCCDTGT